MCLCLQVSVVTPTVHEGTTENPALRNVIARTTDHATFRQGSVCVREDGTAQTATLPAGLGNTVLIVIRTAQRVFMGMEHVTPSLEPVCVRPGGAALAVTVHVHREPGALGVLIPVNVAMVPGVIMKLVSV